MDGKREKDGKSSDRHPLDESKHDKPKSVLGKRKPTHLTRQRDKKQHREQEDEELKTYPNKYNLQAGKRKKRNWMEAPLDVSQPPMSRAEYLKQQQETASYASELDRKLNNPLLGMPHEFVLPSHRANQAYARLEHVTQVLDENEDGEEEEFPADLEERIVTEKELKAGVDEPEYHPVHRTGIGSFFRVNDVKNIEQGVRQVRNEDVPSHLLNFKPKGEDEDPDGLETKKQFQRINQRRVIAPPMMDNILELVKRRESGNPKRQSRTIGVVVGTGPGRHIEQRTVDPEMYDNLPRRKWAATRPHPRHLEHNIIKAGEREDESERVSERIHGGLNIWDYRETGLGGNVRASTLPWLHRNLRSDLSGAIMYVLNAQGEYLPYTNQPLFEEFYKDDEQSRYPELFPERWFNYKGIPGHH